MALKFREPQFNSIRDLVRLTDRPEGEPALGYLATSMAHGVFLGAVSFSGREVLHGGNSKAIATTMHALFTGGFTFSDKGLLCQGEHSSELLFDGRALRAEFRGKVPKAVDELAYSLQEYRVVMVEVLQ